MRRIACVAVIGAALGSLGANLLITQHAAIVSGALTELRFKPLPGDPKRIGAPPRFKVTKATLDYLKKLESQNKIIEIQGDGSIVVK